MTFVTTARPTTIRFQEDADNDGVGDVCEIGALDGDADGVLDAADNCPGNFNPFQTDQDNDGLGDACDPDAGDQDGDGRIDAFDNCPAEFNPTQDDRDNDGLGDACDDDSDGDGIPDTYEDGNNLNRLFSGDAGWDNDGDGASNREEWTSDTAADDASDVFQVGDFGSGQVLEFDSSGNRLYTLETTSDITQSNGWFAVPGYIDLAGSNGVFTVDLNDLDAIRWYRLTVRIP